MRKVSGCAPSAVRPMHGCRGEAASGPLPLGPEKRPCVGVACLCLWGIGGVLLVFAFVVGLNHRIMVHR